MAIRFPHRFAAVVPVAGFYRWPDPFVPPDICELRDVPIWAFHGARDSAVPLAMEAALVEAVKNCGGSVRFTVYDDAEHEDTWRKAYADPALFGWMLSPSLKK